MSARLRRALRTLDRTFPLAEIAVGGVGAGVAVPLAAAGHSALAALACGVAVGAGSLLGERRERRRTLRYDYRCTEHRYLVSSSDKRVCEALRVAHEQASHDPAAVTR